MIKTGVIVALLAAVLLLGASLVRVENQRYAMEVGLCIKPGLPPGLTGWDGRCLAKAKTRTNWWAHLYYAVADSL